MRLVKQDPLRSVVMSAALILAFAVVSSSQPEQEANEPLFYHTVRFELRPEADPAELERVLDMMREVGEKLDVVESEGAGVDEK